ncbi:MAG: NADH-quinone oxidoreductase subunit G, partial [Pseudomonadota bacterium]|nr:NADH-quinone oxidoreductase subunit G [Pseudomonadota bacterium]
FALYQTAGWQRVAEVPVYAVDGVVRRAKSLQRTPLARPAEIRLHPNAARQLGLAEKAQAAVRQNGAQRVLPLVLDEAVAEGCVWVSAAVALGPAMGDIDINAADH